MLIRERGPGGGYEVAPLVKSLSPFFYVMFGQVGPRVRCHSFIRALFVTRRSASACEGGEGLGVINA